MTIKESTTLLIGYGLGDVNVLTALDWSRNVFKAAETTYPSDVIQILWTESPKETPYRDKNGMVIFETEDLSAFFDEFKVVREHQLKQEKANQEALELLSVTPEDKKA